MFVFVAQGTAQPDSTMSKYISYCANLKTIKLQNYFRDVIDLPRKGQLDERRNNTNMFWIPPSPPPPKKKEQQQH